MGDSTNPPPSTTAPQEASAPGAATSAGTTQATTQPIRAELIDTAVRFLKNPKVVDSPMSRKVAFLESKGLTSAEVAVALARAEGGASATAATPSLPAHHTPLSSSPPPPPPPPPPRSFRELLASTALAAGGCYLVYSLVSKYILPRIEWPTSPQTDARLQALTDSITRLEAAQREHQTQQRTHADGLQQRLARVETDSTVGDIRAEIASLRTLLLGRGQFPAAPAATWAPASAAIPKWQLARPKQGEEAAAESSLATGSSIPTTQTAAAAAAAPNATSPAAATATDMSVSEGGVSTGLTGAAGEEGDTGAAAALAAQERTEAQANVGD